MVVKWLLHRRDNVLQRSGRGTDGHKGRLSSRLLGWIVHLANSRHITRRRTNDLEARPRIVSIPYTNGAIPRPSNNFIPSRTLASIDSQRDELAGMFNLLIKLRTVDTVLMSMQVNGCGFAFFPAMLESSPDKKHSLPVLVRNLLSQPERLLFLGCCGTSRTTGVGAAEHRLPDVRRRGLLVPKMRYKLGIQQGSRIQVRKNVCHNFSRQVRSRI